jgi:hypothetical protein
MVSPRPRAVIRVTVLAAAAFQFRTDIRPHHVRSTGARGRRVASGHHALAQKRQRNLGQITSKRLAMCVAAVTSS